MIEAPKFTKKNDRLNLFFLFYSLIKRYIAKAILDAILFIITAKRIAGILK